MGKTAQKKRRQKKTVKGKASFLGLLTEDDKKLRSGPSKRELNERIRNHCKVDGERVSFPNFLVKTDQLEAWRSYCENKSAYSGYERKAEEAVA